MWNLQGMGVPPNPVHLQPAAGYTVVRSESREAPVRLDDMFRAYGVRAFTAAKLGELGFTIHTLVHMKDKELDDMMNWGAQNYRLDLLVGERYGIKAAIRAQRRRLIVDEELRGTTNTMDALFQQGLTSWEPLQQEKQMVVSRGDAGRTRLAALERWKRVRRGRGSATLRGGGGRERVKRPREHPFIVTEPGEVARGKKNGLDYLFYLYEKSRDLLIQVQNKANNRGEPCPTKVSNKVFEFAYEIGADDIRRAKIRHYLHCYALHCLDNKQSDALRRECKLRGLNMGAWREACYKPLVEISARRGWDIDAIFNEHPQLCFWYVPIKLRQRCHAERERYNFTASTSASHYSGTALLWE